ncbi:MAG: cob(II)yrinic acid a,c-diamide reductase, partial [Blastococcus sp.]|nr:cob(II)yrinic acid a,c-diamide reductase [Blastococcus sp.]
RDEADRLLTVPGSLGILDRAVDRAVALGRGAATGGTLVLAAADHPVAAHGVSPYDPSVTRDVLRAAVAGTSLGATAARTVGLERRIVDAGVTGGPHPGVSALGPSGLRGDLVNTPAMTVADTQSLVEAGRRLGREVGTAGIVALGEIGVANTAVAAALACGLLGADPATVTGLGSGADAAMLDRKRDAVAAAVGRARRAHPALGDDPLTALAELGGPELAVLAGVALGAAQVGAVVVVDGFAVSLAALVAVQLEPAVQACLVAGQRSRERGHALVLEQLGCEPLLDLRMRAGEGVGAALATGLLLDGLALRRGTARVDY